jgi:hypothetical protein
MLRLRRIFSIQVKILPERNFALTRISNFVGIRIGATGWDFHVEWRSDPGAPTAAPSWLECPVPVPVLTAALHPVCRHRTSQRGRRLPKVQVVTLL